MKRTLYNKLTMHIQLVTCMRYKLDQWSVCLYTIVSELLIHVGRSITMALVTTIPLFTDNNTHSLCYYNRSHTYNRVLPDRMSGVNNLSSCESIN